MVTALANQFKGV